MPQLDQTGPRGDGPRTGRGLGNCPGTRGMGRNRGQSNNQMTKEEEIKILQKEKENIDQKLEDLKSNS